MKKKKRKYVTRRRIEWLADAISLSIWRNKKGEWFYWENGVRLDLGKNNAIAELNLIEMMQ